MTCVKLFILLVVPSICYAQQNSVSSDESLFVETFGSLVKLSSVIRQRKPSVNVSGLKKKYTFSTIKVNWWKARELCETRGEEFASIQSDLELKTFLADYEAAKMTTNRMWIGGSDLAKEGLFVWATRPPAPFAYTFWASKEPNNVNEKEHCLDIWPKHKGIWNDSQCEAEFEFACQKFE